jgi:hypothetical protein
MFSIFKLGGKHPPAHTIIDLAPPLVPPLSRNNKTLLFHHLQQHGFEKPEYGVCFRKSYPTKEKTLKEMLACGIQGKADQESKTLFAEILTNSGSLKIQVVISFFEFPLHIVELLLQDINSVVSDLHLLLQGGNALAQPFHLQILLHQLGG